jgi:cytochrome P450
LPQEPTVWQRIKLGRRNLIAVWSEAAFEYDFVATKIFALNIFVCNTPETVQYALSTNNSRFERKSPAMRHMLEPLIGDGLIISDGETWRKRRRIVGPIVHGSRLGEFAPVMTETALEMAERWRRLPEGTQIDTQAEMARLTAEIICRAIFGQELGQERTREIVEGFTAFQRTVSLIDLPSVIGLPDWLPRVRRPAFHRATRRIHRAVDNIIATYRNRDNVGKTSVIGRLIEARDEETGEPLDDTALRNEAGVIFLAGSETTASTLSFAWFLISQAPDVEARLHEEIDKVLAGRSPTHADVPKLVYTRAIIEETLRLYPPIPFLAREALTDETIAGTAVPRNSIVMVVPFLLHRKKGLWDRPDHFVPERFLPGGSGAPSKWAYLPFSIGPRICAGMSFGLTEAILCLATLAQQFKLRLAPGHVVEPVCKVSLRPGTSLPMTVHRRRATAPSAAAGRRQEVAACPFRHG